MTDNIDEVLKKIKKILRLSQNNPSEEEALTAAKMARTLLAKHSLTMADVDVTDKAESEVVRQFANSNKRIKRWENYLAYSMHEFIPVRSLIVEGYDKSKRLQFIGEEADVIVAIEMYTYLRSTIWRMARSHFNGEKRLMKSYAIGAVQRLKERFIEMKEESKQEGSSYEGSYELMTLDKLVKADNFIDTLNTREQRDRKLNIDAMANNLGYMEADQIGLQAQVEG